MEPFINNTVTLPSTAVVGGEISETPWQSQALPHTLIFPHLVFHPFQPPWDILSLCFIFHSYRTTNGMHLQPNVSLLYVSFTVGPYPSCRRTSGAHSQVNMVSAGAEYSFMQPQSPAKAAWLSVRDPDPSSELGKLAHLPGAGELHSASLLQPGDKGRHRESRESTAQAQPGVRLAPLRCSRCQAGVRPRRPTAPLPLACGVTVSFKTHTGYNIK